MTAKPNVGTQDNRSRIPAFATRQEEAEWWDTHDITDYLDELEPVDVRFGVTLTEDGHRDPSRTLRP